MSHDLAHTVYEHPEYLHVLETSTPVAEHVKVDLELWGCPVNKYQVLECVSALLQNRTPFLPTHSVCLDCKRRGTVCVMVANGTLCLGPATRTGCGALCPASGRGCYGCFGPAPGAEFATTARLLQGMEHFPGEAALLMRNISGYAPEFRSAVDTLLEGGKS